VCVCQGCCSLSVCVCDLLIFSHLRKLVLAQSRESSQLGEQLAPAGLTLSVCVCDLLIFLQLPLPPAASFSVFFSFFSYIIQLIFYRDWPSKRRRDPPVPRHDRWIDGRLPMA